MNLKLNAIIGITFLIIGAYLGSKFSPKPSPVVPPQVAQDQAQKCRAVVSKTTAKDGSVTESVSFEADSKQAQENKAEKAAESIGHLSLGGYVNNSFKSGASLGLNIKSWDFNFDSDLNKDHRISVKKVLLRF